MSAIRKAPKALWKYLFEIILNSLEIIRKSNNVNESSIIVKLYFTNKIIDSIVCIDKANGDTGISINQLQTMFVQYHHEGDDEGFSEYGQGGTESMLMLADKINVNTQTNQTHNILELDLNTAKKLNHIANACNINSDNEEIKNIYKNLWKLKETGTIITLENICDQYKNIEFYDDSFNICKDIQDHLIELDNNIKVKITFEIYNNKKLEQHREIEPVNLIKKNKFTQIRYLYIFQDKKNKNNKRTVFKNDDNNYVSYYDYVNKDKNKNIVKNAKTNKIDIDREKWELQTSIKLKFNTTDNEDFCKSGFNFLRKSKGGVIKTNNDSLNLKWRSLSSHRTRHNNFEAEVIYDKTGDDFLKSDKSKEVSNDRVDSIQKDLLHNILTLSAKYIQEMKNSYEKYTGTKKTSVVVEEKPVVVEEKPVVVEEKPVVEVDDTVDDIVDDTVDDIVDDTVDDIVDDTVDDIVDDIVDDTVDDTVDDIDTVDDTVEVDVEVEEKPVVVEENPVVVEEKPVVVEENPVVVILDKNKHNDEPDEDLEKTEIGVQKVPNTEKVIPSDKITYLRNLEYINKNIENPNISVDLCNQLNETFTNQLDELYKKPILCNLDFIQIRKDNDEEILKDIDRIKKNSSNIINKIILNINRIKYLIQYNNSKILGNAEQVPHASNIIKIINDIRLLIIQSK